MKTLYFSNVYLNNTSVVGGILESKGPLGSYLDYTFSHKKRHISYEDQEIEYIKKALNILFKKSDIEQIDLSFGGELSSQIGISNQIAMHIPCSFIGIYSACASFIMGLILASNFISTNNANNSLVFTSSNYYASRRQFRYPFGYGIQKKEETTLTSSGACGVILDHVTNSIKFTKATIGKVFDVGWSNYTDLGSPMAYAAFACLKEHLKNTSSSISSYDYIVTGDLSSFGSKIFLTLLKSEGYIIKKHLDGGSFIYGGNKKYFCGGSGPFCIGFIAFTYIKELLENKQISKVLLIGTGALFSKTLASQKHKMPIVAHAIEMESNG